MYTVCPKCTLALAVTAADLRAGQGYVRCGRCANVFNALLALQDETDTSPGLPASSLPPPVPDAVPEPTPIAAPEATEEAARFAAAHAPAPEREPEPPMMVLAEGEEAYTEISPELLAPEPLERSRRAVEAEARTRAREAMQGNRPADDFIAEPGDGATEVDEFRGTGTYETIVLEGDGFLQTEELLPEQTIDAEIAAVSRQLAAAHGRPQGGSPQADVAAPPPAAAPSPLGRENEPDPNADADAQAMAAAIAEAVAQLGPAEPQRPRHGALWSAAAVLGVLLLAGQAVNHWRNQLATMPALSAPLSRLYAALGRPLTPEWELAAYDVRQLGASADSTDNRAIHVRLSLANRGRTPQGLPLVRLTLIDRYGKPLSAGELTPAQYLPPAQRGLVLLAPDQRIDTDVSVVDATQQASSFELDVCLPRPGGGLRCGADAALAASRP
jgi:predicted Zn finger-like uncharacterized protein